MKLLLINGNTSETITGKIAAAARDAASAGTDIVAVTATFGARIISTRTENAIAGHAAVSAAATHYHGCDAAIIAVSLDSGLAAVREMLPIPVIGITEAAAFVACALGGRFSIVTFGRHTIPMYNEVVAAYGLDRRLASVRAVDIGTQAYGDLARIRTQVLELAKTAVEEDGAEAIILAGTAMAGWYADLQAHVPVPLLDGVACGVQFAESLVRLHVKKATQGSFCLPAPKELINVDGAVMQLCSRGAVHSC